MLSAQVVGHGTATVKHPSMEGWKLLVVQTLDAGGRPDGDPILAIDSLGAGIRDTVIISSDGQGTRELVECGQTPIRWSVVGIVDDAGGGQ
jgi:ethanolamine utilization protein EutN